jgi:hypothetical protein
MNTNNTKKIIKRSVSAAASMSEAHVSLEDERASDLSVSYNLKSSFPSYFLFFEEKEVDFTHD